MIEGLAHGDPALYVLLVIVLALVSVVGLMMRSIIKGDLVPKATVDLTTAQLRERVTVQTAALSTLTDANVTLVATNATQATSLSDLAEAAHLQVKIGEALHRQLVEEP